MKIKLYELKDKIYETQASINFAHSEYEHVFSLRHIGKVDVKIKAKEYKEIAEVELEIKADLILASSYTLADVNYKLEASETLEFSATLESDDIIPLTNNEIDLDEHILGIIIAHIPLRVINKGEKIPQVKGVRVLKQEEFEKEEAQKLDPRLSALDKFK